MPGESSISQLTVMLFVGLFIAAALNDVAEFKIPNRICFAIALLYPAYVLASPQPVDWVGALLVAALIFAVGFFFFSFNWLGGGDAKLMAASALWAGPSHIVEFMLVTTLAGGALALLLLHKDRLSFLAAPSLLVCLPPNSNAAKQRMPYGVAIAAGNLMIAVPLLTGA